MPCRTTPLATEAMNPTPLFSDLLGWTAAAFTLLAFSCTNLVHLRLIALGANAAFIAYGVSAQLWPVAALHFVLVPINLWRLWLATRKGRARLRQVTNFPDPSAASSVTPAP